MENSFGPRIWAGYYEAILLARLRMIRFHKTLVCTFCALFIASGDPALAAQSTSGEIKELTTAVTQLATAIDRLGFLLEQQSLLQKDLGDQDRLDTAISYLNFRSRRIEMIERDIQSSRSMKDRMEDILGQLESQLKSLDSNSSQYSQEELAETLKDMEFRKKSLNERIARVDADIIQQENKMRDLQLQIEDIESFVQKNLKF